MSDSGTYKNNKIKVAMITKHLEITGIGTVVMNYCKNLDKNKYDLTIIAGSPIAEKYICECEELGIKIIMLPSRRGEPFKHYVALWRALRKEKYDIVHDHGNSSMMAIELTIAKLTGVKVRIAHSHNSRCPNMRIHRILNPYFKKVYTKALACGNLAGEWLFGKGEFEVLPNGFHPDKFTFSQENRDSVRSELKIEDKFVIGHIGRINEQKNQEYLLRIFEKIAPMRKDAILLLVGIGPNFEKIREMVINNPYRDQIIMYGETDNPAAFYSVMDVFLLPSRFEGLPVALLEAQISGLPCIVSDRVTREVDFGEIEWKSIDEDPENWAESIMSVKTKSVRERLDYPIKYKKDIEKYDINKSITQLNNIYLNELA